MRHGGIIRRDVQQQSCVEYGGQGAVIHRRGLEPGKPVVAVAEAARLITCILLRPGEDPITLFHPGLSYKLQGPTLE